MEDRTSSVCPRSLPPWNGFLPYPLGCYWYLDVRPPQSCGGNHALQFAPQQPRPSDASSGYVCDPPKTAFDRLGGSRLSDGFAGAGGRKAEGQTVATYR